MNGDPGAESGELSDDDCDDWDTCLRSGVRGAMESAANCGRGDIICEKVPGSQSCRQWRARSEWVVNRPRGSPTQTSYPWTRPRADLKRSRFRKIQQPGAWRRLSRSQLRSVGVPRRCRRTRHSRQVDEPARSPPQPDHLSLPPRRDQPLRTGRPGQATSLGRQGHDGCWCQSQRTCEAGGHLHASRGHWYWRQRGSRRGKSGLRERTGCGGEKA